MKKFRDLDRPRCGAGRIEPIRAYLQNPPASLESRIIAHFKAHLQTSCPDHWTSLRVVAATFHVPPRSLAALFLKYTGETVHRFMRRLRVARGAELLRSTTLSVKEIAVATGYDCAAHFSRDFKQVLGVSPTIHRRQR